MCNFAVRNLLNDKTAHTMNRYIRFDWAAKNMLRNKTDFAIFEDLIGLSVAEVMEL